MRRRRLGMSVSLGGGRGFGFGFNRLFDRRGRCWDRCDIQRQFGRLRRDGRSRRLSRFARDFFLLSGNSWHNKFLLVTGDSVGIQTDVSKCVIIGRTASGKVQIEFTDWRGLASLGQQEEFRSQLPQSRALCLACQISFFAAFQHLAGAIQA